MKKVMVFGVFDGVHDGHRALFKEARHYGNYLIIAVAQDYVVEYLKGRLPKLGFGERVDELRKEKLVDKVVMGDTELGSYEVVLKHRPEIIAIGYDQEAFRKNLEENLKKFDWKPEIKIIPPYEPKKYHSSLLN